MTISFGSGRNCRGMIKRRPNKRPPARKKGRRDEDVKFSRRRQKDPPAADDKPSDYVDGDNGYILV